VFVFIASSVVHMATPMHKGDHKKLPNEDAVLDAMRKAGVQPGGYMFPHAGSMKECNSPEMLGKFQRGPVGWLIAIPNGPMPIGKSLVQWFVYSLVIALFAGYVGTLALTRGAGYDQVFRLTGTVAILGYAFSNVCDSIWKGVSWGTTAKYVFDGLIYGLLTAGTFGWLWPAA
jgi:hypothetical protein